jgi:hypothetical protein
MDSPKPDNNELLTGLIDGHLSSAESKRIGDELVKNPQTSEQLEQLEKIRSSLLRGRQTAKLPAKFSANIVDLAMTRAREMGEDAPDWLFEKAATATNPDALPNLKSRWWIPVTTVATVGVVAFGLAKISITYNQMVESDRKQQIASFNEKQQEQQSETRESLAKPQTIVPTPEADLIAKDAHSLERQLAIETAAIDEKGEPNPSANDATHKAMAEQSAVASKGALKQQQAQSVGKMMAVYEVVLNRQAQENDAITVLLERNGLGSVKELALGSDQMQKVLDSGWVGKPEEKGGSEVIVLKGTPTMLSNFFIDLLSSSEDFPAVGMDVVQDKSLIQIIEQMSSMDFVDPSADDKHQSFARKLMGSSSSGFVSMFGAGSKKFQRFPETVRRSAKSTRQMTQQSLVILVIRYTND